MNYSKKQAMKFAMYEWELREGKWEPLDDDPNWTLADQVKDDGLDEYYSNTNDAARSIATIMVDHYIGSKEEFKKAKKFYGKMLWEKALENYVIGNHFR